jgi:cold shock CspA family protein
MTESNKINTGYISRFDIERQFGFIESENENSYFFFLDKTELIQLKRKGLIDKIHKFCTGDEVEFELGPSKKDANKIVAYNLKFIKNEKRQKLIDEAIQFDMLSGFLKLIDEDKFFVKHLTTYIFVPLVISAWETDLDEIYNNRTNSLVNFKLTQSQKNNKLKAVLTDVKFCDEYYELLAAIDNETEFPALLTGKNTQGLFATIFNGRIEGFIPISKYPDNLELLKFEKLKKGNITNVRVKQILNNKRVSLTLAYDE